MVDGMGRSTPDQAKYTTYTLNDQHFSIILIFRIFLSFVSIDTTSDAYEHKISPNSCHLSFYGYNYMNESHHGYSLYIHYHILIIKRDHFYLET